MTTKSPFFVIDNFLSPMECEGIVERSIFEFPNMIDGVPIKSVTRNILTEELVLDYLDELIEPLEEYYGYKHVGILPFDIEHYPQQSQNEGLRCENSLYNGRWLRVNDHELTGIIFLKDDNTGTNFDDYFEVYGAKLQFPNHRFSFHPQRGQLVIFPSGPNFLNSVIPPKIGDLYQIRFQIVGTAPDGKPFVYNPAMFPGDFRSWFK